MSGLPSRKSTPVTPIPDSDEAEFVDKHLSEDSPKRHGLSEAADEGAQPKSKVSIGFISAAGFLAVAWVLNTVGIELRAVAVIYMGLMAAVLAACIATYAITDGEAKDPCYAVLAFATITIVSTIAVHFVGWQTFFE